MEVIDVRNVHKALPEALYRLRNDGVERESRNGPVTVFPTPVTTVYKEPTERVIFWPQRDANPFFHLFEALWMLAGRNDVAYPASFVKRMRSFSDDGVTFHGAYGHRWINHFGFDQLEVIAARLRANPDDRRNVLAMWDAGEDLGKDGKDLPCNTHAYFSVTANGKLDMTVCNRSNDLVWGAYGANAVHFSILQEYMAAAVGVDVGRYYQVSNNLHAYKDTLDQVAELADQADDPLTGSQPSPYEQGIVRPFPLVSTPIDIWRQDLGVFLSDGPIVGFRDPFFRRVVTPMHAAYRAYKSQDADRFNAARDILTQCKATDWRLAATQWIDRREKRYLEKKAKS